LFQVEAFCIANLIHSVMDSNDEFLVLDIHFVNNHGGMDRAFELLHEVLTKPRYVRGDVFTHKLHFVYGEGGEGGRQTGGLVVQREGLTDTTLF
jgi:hypothetical protein